MDLPYKTHFGVDCKACGVSCYTEITQAQKDLDDPVAILRTLSAEDQAEVAEFFRVHKEHGATPALVGLAIMPQA
jgi:hypothetical protein